MKCSLGISNFLDEISSLSHSVVFLYFFALITEEGFIISPCCSLEFCIQMGVSFLFSFAFHFFSQLFVRPPQTTILPSWISFSWGCFFPPFIFISCRLITLQYCSDFCHTLTWISHGFTCIWWWFLSLHLVQCYKLHIYLQWWYLAIYIFEIALFFHITVYVETFIDQYVKLCLLLFNCMLLCHLSYWWTFILFL